MEDTASRLGPLFEGCGEVFGAEEAVATLRTGLVLVSGRQHQLTLQDGGGLACLSLYGLRSPYKDVLQYGM